MDLKHVLNFVRHYPNGDTIRDSLYVDENEKVYKVYTLMRKDEKPTPIIFWKDTPVGYKYLKEGYEDWIEVAIWDQVIECKLKHKSQIERIDMIDLHHRVCDCYSCRDIERHEKTK